MVNKSHAPRNKKPAPSAATINGDDTSFIVFGDDKKTEQTMHMNEEGQGHIPLHQARSVLRLSKLTMFLSAKERGNGYGNHA